VAEERIHRDAAEGFDRGAVAYERARPSYPPEVVACIVGRARLGPDRRVLDLAAGTGKLTRLLVPSGAEVVAVEPVPGMRDQLRAVLPDLEVLDGTAEDIPLGDASVDAVTVAQAIHWFDLDVAVPEILRVLTPGGTLVVTYSLPDVRVGWVQRFVAALDTGRGLPFHRYGQHDYGEEISAVAGAGLGPLGTFEWEWGQPCDAELLVVRAASISVVASLPDDERDRVLERVAELATTDPELAGRAAFALPYVTTVLWWPTT
jgi:SAM-dependent methyltransferase